MRRTEPVTIPGSSRLLVGATLHSVAELLATTPDVPPPMYGKLYIHNLTAAALLTQAATAGTEIKVRNNSASITIVLAIPEVHGIDLTYVMFSSDVSTDAILAYGVHNRAIAELKGEE